MIWLGLLIACLPLKQLQVTSPYGERMHPLSKRTVVHRGVDLRARHDTVYAILAGRVAALAYHPVLGISLELQHGAFRSGYGHLSRTLVAPHDRVQAGQPIAISGATGKVTAAHLHFSVTFYGHALDPIKFLDQLR